MHTALPEDGLRSGNVLLAPGLVELFSEVTIQASKPPLPTDEPCWLVALPPTPSLRGVKVLSVLMQSDILLAADAQGGDLMGMLLMMLPIFVLFYLLFIRPQRKEQSTRQMMLDNMKKNDRIVTVGGILGVVTNVDREKKEITIKVDESSGTKLRMTLNSVARVLVDESSKQSSS